MQRVTEARNNVVITDRMWARLLSSTNQPSFLTLKDIEAVRNVYSPKYLPNSVIKEPMLSIQSPVDNSLPNTDSGEEHHDDHHIADEDSLVKQISDITTKH